VKIPVIGMGGIVTADDALQFLIAGARAIAIGTANFINPHATLKVVEGIKKFLFEERITDINDLIGSFRD